CRWLRSLICGVSRRVSRSFCRVRQGSRELSAFFSRYALMDAHVEQSGRKIGLRIAALWHIHRDDLNCSRFCKAGLDGGLFLLASSLQAVFPRIAEGNTIGAVHVSGVRRANFLYGFL